MSIDLDTVAVITDIHGNLPALQAALARVEDLGIESVFCGGDLVGYGKPWVREYGGVLFVNCGSVGKPKDGDPRGAVAALTSSAGSVAVTIERIEYNAETVAAEVREAGLPGEFADKLLLAA